MLDGGLSPDMLDGGLSPDMLDGGLSPDMLDARLSPDMLRHTVARKRQQGEAVPGSVRVLPGRVLWAGYLVALAAFVVVIFVRGGPGFTDARALTLPTTAIAHGDLRDAARTNALPQPLGYPLLASPFVAALDPLIGSGTWCTDSPSIPQFKIVRDVWPPCSGPNVFAAPPKPRWYRSQGVLGLLAWVVLVFGAVQLLRAAGAERGPEELALVLGLVAVPAASDGLVEAFHPQDLVCVGLLALGLASARRARWATAGAVLGAAFVCKQFALLALVAAFAAAPGWRSRVRMVVPAVGAVAAATLPFAVVEPSPTFHSLVAVAHFTGGEITSTVVGMTQWDEFTKLAVARDGPVVLAVVIAAWAWWRARGRLLEPVPFLGLAVACLGARLVFEVLNTSYYLLAVSLLLLVLDVAARRVPVRSVAWIAVMRWWVNPLGGHLPSWGNATVFALGAVVAVVLGLVEIPRCGDQGDLDDQDGLGDQVPAGGAAAALTPPSP